MKINANELRIGNWLLHNGKPKQIGSIHSDNTVRFILEDVRTEGCFNLNNGTISPIPLTPEILIKAGFYKGMDENTYCIECYMYDCETQSLYHDDGSLVHFDSVEIKTLHALQNLIFSLTGKELPIELL